MFAQVWNKYLPVLKILLKRSLNEEQTMMMDASDFQRAAGGRKIKFSYSVTLNNGRLQTMDKPSAIAKEFVTILQEDDMIKQFIRRYDIEFSLNNSFQLSIRNITPSAAEAAPEETAKEK